MVCLIFFFFFFLINHKIKNRCLATQSSLFKQFFSRVALYPNFRRISLECFFFFFFCPIFKDSSFTLAQCRKYLYTWRPDSCECEGIFSLSIFLSRYFRQFYLYPFVSWFRIVSKMNNFPAKKLLCIGIHASFENTCIRFPSCIMVKL